MIILYTILLCVGTVVPLSYVIGWATGGNASIAAFFDLAQANAIATALSWDLLLSALCFVVLALHLAMRDGVRHVWLAIVVCFFIGLSAGLPLLLLLREWQKRYADEALI